MNHRSFWPLTFSFRSGKVAAMDDGMTADEPRQFAAIDLGSNSFHMVVAQESPDGELVVVDRIKESVRLAAGLNPKTGLADEAQERALKCLSHFGERISEFPNTRVRAVGTNTLRKAKDAVAFLAQAEAALGHRIDVISGREEARLIYQGVVRDVESPGCILVLDIGGGSTEVIIGEGQKPRQLDSLYMGCVSWSQRFFPGGKVTKSAMDKAIVSARREIASVVREYRKAGWEAAIGSSGTIVAIETILQGQGASSIDVEGLEWLRKRLIKIGSMADVDLEGLSNNRRPVLAGGVAILSAVFQALRIQEMRATKNALREGVLVDLVGRQGHSDIREQTVRRLMERWDIDGRQAFRVQQTALALFDQCRMAWDLKERHRSLIRWASAMHEAGLFMTYTGYHKHGGYMMIHTEMPGFSRQEQSCVAALIRGHRGKPTKEKIGDIAPMWDRKLLHLVALLRIATRIHRRRSPRPPPRVVVEVADRMIKLSFPDNWLDDRPLSRADLEEDGVMLQPLGYTVHVV